MKKGLFQAKYLFFVLIVLAVLGFTAVLLQISLKNASRTAFPSKFTKPASIVTQISPMKSSDDAMIGWKLFKNENFYYEVKYPAEWKLLPSIKKGDKTDTVGMHGIQIKGQVIDLYKDYSYSRTQPFLEVTSSINATKSDFDSRKISWKGDSLIFQGNSAVKSIVISEGEPAINQLPGINTNLLVYSDNTNTLYEIICNEDLANKGFCDQILSTFKFTN